MNSSTVLEQNIIKLDKESFNIKFNLINTKYEAIENIGTGAYGVVCKALNKKTKEKLAIKKIPGAFDCFLIAKRTYREIKILKHLKHDNIISIRDIIKPNNNNIHDFKDVYVVFDLMESDLHRVIHSNQELTDDHMKYFLYQIMKALKYIHSAKIIHRDLKPSNILVNENCDLKIGDFGMARSINITDEEIKKYNLTQYVATRWYRAPELIYSCEYSSAIDQWSVGCIFSEMITSKPLFPSKDALSLIKLIFGYLGIPNKQFLKSVESDLFRNIIFAAASKPVKKVNFRELYPNLCDEGFDLLSKLLTIDPKQRISATEALEHPYLLKYRDPITETNANSPLDFDFEKSPFMIENGTDKNLILLKEAILAEAEDFLKINKLNKENILSNIKSNEINNSREQNEDLTKTILKIDEFLENLDKNIPQDSLNDTKILKNNENNDDDEILILNDFDYNDQIKSSILNHNDTNGASTSTTTCSEDTSINKKSVSNDVKSLLKQKLLDVAAHKVGTKESKTKRKTKVRHLNPKKVIPSSKVKTEEPIKTIKKDIPIRPKPVTNVTSNSNLPILPQHQIFIQSNQPIIILNTSNLLPTNNTLQTNKAASLFTVINAQNNNIMTTNIDTETKTNVNIKNNLTKSSTEKNNNNNNNIYSLPQIQSKNDPKSVDQLTKLLSKYKVNDNNLLGNGEPPVSLIITPRGTADGYSIGIDYDNLMTEIPGYCRNFNSSLDDLDNIVLQSLDNTQVLQNNTNQNLIENNSTIDINTLLEQLDSPIPMVFSPTLN